MNSYEKKYKEALARAREIHLSNDEMEYLFPELKESDDERIREVLIEYFKRYKEQEECGIKTFYGIPTDDILAWLEKQKEYESTDFEYVWDRTDCGELTSALDKYSKEAIINMCHAWYDKGIELERKSWLEKQGEQKQEFNYPEFGFDDILAIQCCMETAKKVQEDKELYDKLLSLHSRLYDACCFEKQGDHRQDPCKHCKMTYSTCYSFPCDEKKAFEQGKSALEAINEEKVDNQFCVKPVNKVEPKFKVGDFKAKDWYVSEVDGKIHNLYYSADKVEPKDYSSIDPHFFKPTDKTVEEYNITGIGSKHAQGKLGEMIKNLKSVNETLEQKPAWSEEDENIKEWIMSDINKLLALNRKSFVIADKEIIWLKSLRSQNTWKPSWEQLDALEYHLKHTNENSRLYKETEKLYDQLKKLK